MALPSVLSSCFSPAALLLLSPQLFPRPSSAPSNPGRAGPSSISISQHCPGSAQSLFLTSAHFSPAVSGSVFSPALSSPVEPCPFPRPCPALSICPAISRPVCSPGQAPPLFPGPAPSPLSISRDLPPRAASRGPERLRHRVPSDVNASSARPAPPL